MRICEAQDCLYEGAKSTHKQTLMSLAVQRAFTNEGSRLLASCWLLFMVLLGFLWFIIGLKWRIKVWGHIPILV